MLRGLVEHDVPTAIANSGFRSVVDADNCIACGDCVDRCPFGALSIPDDIAVVDANRCVGCGVCVSVCATEALSMERLPDELVPSLPSDRNEWARLRAQSRGLE